MPNSWSVLAKAETLTTKYQTGDFRNHYGNNISINFS